MPINESVRVTSDVLLNAKWTARINWNSLQGDQIFERKAQREVEGGPYEYDLTIQSIGGDSAIVSSKKLLERWGHHVRRESGGDGAVHVVSTTEEYVPSINRDAADE